MKLQWFEVHVRGAVGPRGLEREPDAAVGEALETVVRQRRAQAVAHDAFEHFVATGADRKAGVQIEAVVVHGEAALGAVRGGRVDAEQTLYGSAGMRAERAQVLRCTSVSGGAGRLRQRPLPSRG